MGCLDGKVAVVTGSGQGVGRGIAEYFAAQGAEVVTNNRHPLMPEERPADEPEEEFERYRALRGDAEATASAIRARGGQAVACFGDVADPEDAKRLVDCAIHEFGRIDILVNNAAGLGQGTIEETCEESWQRQTRAKLDGAFHTMHYAVPYMKKQGGGCILNCSSNAWLGFSGLDAYSAANAGVVGLTWAASKELFEYGIRVNAYCPQADSPGHVREFGRTVRQLAQETGEAPDPEVIAHAERMHGTAYDMAPFLAWLATDAEKGISGSVFQVTGAGLIARYTEPEVVAKMEKDEGPWTIEELDDEAPSGLFHGYESIASVDDWGDPAAADPILRHGIIFPKGKPASGIPGEAYLNLLVGPDDPSGCALGTVTFAPGVMNDWHEHEGWQILACLGGLGVYEDKEGRKCFMRPGDVVKVPPHLSHRHGAAPGQSFSQLGLVLPAQD